MGEFEVTINGLSRKTGEGIALDWDDEDEFGPPLMVRDGLPGERLRVRLEGRADGFPAAQIVEIIKISEDRQKPVCRHYGVCGGCTMQLLRPEAYRNWKRGWIVGLLKVTGIETRVDELAPVTIGTRRRAVFGARRTRKTVQLGYRKRASHELVDLRECPVLVPEIADRLEALRGLVRPLLSRRGVARLTVLATQTGLDVSIDEVKPIDDLALREQLVGLARNMKVARLVVNDEPLVEFAPPLLHFADIAVNPPPKAFLQATEHSQQQMIAHLLALLPERPAKILDLFAGLGTFSLPMAHHHKVLAVEMDKNLLAALKKAADRGRGLKRVEVLDRDLFKMPLSALELKEFDIVVLDPPRAGAKAQVQELAQSDIETIIYISCDPVNFRRDAGVLQKAGYKLHSVKPFDQFLFASHLELIGHFSKA